MTLSTFGRAEPHAELGHRLAYANAQAAAVWARTTELRQRTEQLLAEAQGVRRAIEDARRARRSSPAGRELLQRSEYARLLARLETMPVVEQAKGIIMAQSRCGETEAFDILRRASQRSNIPVRTLAAQIVAKAAKAARPASRPDMPRRPGRAGHARKLTA